MNAFLIVLGFIFCALGGYAIGLRRGYKTYENDYDQGWVDAEAYMAQHRELGQDLDKMMDDLADEYQRKQRQENAEQLVNELEQLFEDDTEEDKTNIIDCGYY